MSGTATTALLSSLSHAKPKPSQVKANRTYLTAAAATVTATAAALAAAAGGYLDGKYHFRKDLGMIFNMKRALWRFEDAGELSFISVFFLGGEGV